MNRRSVVGVALLIVIAAFGAAGARAQETPAPPTISPTPTPSPADPALAATFAQQGRFDQAIGAYQAVVAEGARPERLAAHVALARLYLDEGEPGAAANELEAYLLEAPAGADVRGAQFLLGEALSAQGEWDGALLLYDAYIQAGGGASLYARIGKAEALAYAGRAADAVAEGEALLREEVPADVRLGFILTMAQALEDASPRDAVAWYQRLRDESQSPGDQALALWRSALIQRDLGNDQPWLSNAVTIVERYPGTATALEVVENFPPVKVLMDGYQFGLVYYLNGEYEKARDTFEDLVAAQPPSVNAARASYYLAVMKEGEDNEAAVADYARVVQLDPKVELADDALWWRGRLLELMDRVPEAQDTYRQLVAQYPTAGFGIEARFRLPLLDYDAGKYAEAARAFGEIASDSEGETRQRALLWQGKGLDAQDQHDAAGVTWRAVATEAPDGYYGLRAKVLLGEVDGSSNDAGLEEAPETDWGAIESWLRQDAGVDITAAFEALLYNTHWGMAQEALALGMERRASSELNTLLDDAGQDPGLLYELSRYALTRGVTDISARAAARLLNALPDDVAVTAPPDLLRLAYPAPHADLLDEFTDREDAPDLLLLAMERQESFFDPLAGSTAGALGLMQIIPATGTAIAEELDVEDFRVDDLFRPAVSLEFGAHYIAQQLDSFDGDVYQALAAYNGGPGNAQRWGEAADGDVDRFLAEVEFGQTEAYIKLVMENLAHYRQLYLELDAPSLPED
ncbi:MAG: transglycosylase SLT domain-containing protein [Dehalococcoidia bacterium]